MKGQATKFIKGAMILSLAGLIAKVFSAIYRIPLKNLVGTSGFGDYTTVYSLYALLISPVLVGIPNALTKMIAERVAIEDYGNAKRIYQHALKLLFMIGIGMTLLVLLGADLIIDLANWPRSNIYMIYGFSISIILIALAGVFKSYFQGREVMIPTAMTQIIENFTKAIIGLLIIYILLKLGYDTPIVVGGAAFGVSLSYLLSTAYIAMAHRKHVKKTTVLEDRGVIGVGVTFGQVTKRLLKLAIPISVATAAYSIMNAIDSVTVYNRLGSIGYDKLTIRELYGYMGMSQTVINVPLTISVSLMISIIPAITTAVAKKKHDEVNRKISQGIRLGILLGLPAATGIIILADQLMTLLYQSRAGSEFLHLYGIALVFMIIGQTLAGILQGMGKYLYPAVALTSCAVMKILINYKLLVSDLTLKGAIIGSICYYIVFVLLNYWKLKSVTGVVLNKIQVFLKPAFASLVMGITVYLFYGGMIRVITDYRIVTGLAIGVGVLVYGITLVVTHSLQEEDFSILPYHEKLTRRLKRWGFLK